MLSSKSSHAVTMRLSQQSPLRKAIPFPLMKLAQSSVKFRCRSHHTLRLLSNKLTSILAQSSDARLSQSRTISTATATATTKSNPAAYAKQSQTGAQSSSREENTGNKQLLKIKGIILAGKLVKRTEKPNTRSLELLGRNVKRRDLLQEMTRKWRPGDIYSPHDLTGYAMSKFKKKRIRPPVDVLDMLRIDPLKEYKNVALMADFTSETGRIIHSDRTGLRGRNQRRMAKSIRRAVGIGMLPSIHIHPELSQVRLRWRSRARPGR